MNCNIILSIPEESPLYFKVHVSEILHIYSKTHTDGWYLHPTAHASRLRTAALGQGLLGNDERVFTGRSQESVGGVYRAWQSAAVPHWGLCNIHDLITHCLLLVEEGRHKSWPQTRVSVIQMENWVWGGGGVVREDSNRAERRECPLIPGKPEGMVVSRG